MKKYNISKIRREYTYLFSQNLFKRIIKRYIFNKIKNTNTNTTDYFFDLNYFIENIDRIKKFKNKTIEIMCHPSINNNDFNTLMSDEFKHIKEYFTLISYKDL